MSTAAWTTVCSASADDYLLLVPMQDQPFRGRPNKTRLAFQIRSQTVKRARNYTLFNCCLLLLTPAGFEQLLRRQLSCFFIYPISRDFRDWLVTEYIRSDLRIPESLHNIEYTKSLRGWPTRNHLIWIIMCVSEDVGRRSLFFRVSVLCFITTKESRIVNINVVWK